MASKPTSSNGRPSSQRVSAPTVTNSLFVRIKYNNTLPDLPFDPKFLINPLSLSRYVDYETTSLEQNSKHELLAPNDLGVDIDLILPERYAIPDRPMHDPEDDKLINDDEPLALSAKKSQRDKPHSQLHNKVVPWLKKTEYISTEYNRYGASSEKTETKVGYNVRKNMINDQVFLDKESQIKAINETFEASQTPIEKHPTKADVYATNVMPLLPDFDTWKYTFTQVKLDNEPADPSKDNQRSQAIIRGAYDPELEENFVVYFLPTEITMADRLLDQNNGLEYTEGKEYEYKSSREYSWSAKQNDNADDYFLVFKDDAAYYNRLTMEVNLKKRRNKNQMSSVSTLIVKNRPPVADELEMQANKLRLLKKPHPPSAEEMALTAKSLEDSYEGNQEAPVSPVPKSSVSQPTASKAKSSSGSSSSSSSGSSGDGEDDDDDDDEDDDDDDDDDGSVGNDKDDDEDDDDDDE